MPKMVDTTVNGKPAKVADLLRQHGPAPVVPIPGSREENGSPAGQPGRDGRAFQGVGGIVGDVLRFLADYIALPATSLVTIAAWVLAAWLIDVWDRFPHLAITSPEKRCGKSLLLELLALIVPKPRLTTNISPAALYRVIEAEKPTLLMDEAQSLARRGSEASEVIREILNAGIGPACRVTRCAGASRDQIDEFSVYSPKVFALIGELDGVLADRSLTIELRRKTAADQVKRFRSRIVEPTGNELREKLEKWAQENAERVAEIYGRIDPFPIENDRMAELMMPLQTVLEADGDARATEILAQYARGIDQRDREQESPGAQLLAACREIFGQKYSFFPTTALIGELLKRMEEPWHRWCRGGPINAEAIANLLRPYGIRPALNKARTARGYHRADFAEAWTRYLPSKPPSIPSGPSNTSGQAGQGAQAGRVFQGMHGEDKR